MRGRLHFESKRKANDDGRPDLYVAAHDCGRIPLIELENGAKDVGQSRHRDRSVRYRTELRPPGAYRCVITVEPPSAVHFIAGRRRSNMLWTIAVILIVLWLLGLVSSYTMGGFIHVLLVVAVIMILVNLIQGRRA
jgi:hypothetical protein